MSRRAITLVALVASLVAFNACADATTGPTEPSAKPNLSLCQGTQGAHDC